VSGLRYRAVLIGSSVYEDRGLSDLLGPGNDVQALFDALTHDTWGLFRPQDVIVLPDRPLAEVRERLRAFFDEAVRHEAPDDRVEVKRLHCLAVAAAG
jgi:hypothetical protein